MKQSHDFRPSGRHDAHAHTQVRAHTQARAHAQARTVRRRRRRGGVPLAQLAAYLTVRAQKSLHSTGLPAAHHYWIPSSCISNFESA